MAADSSTQSTPSTASMSSPQQPEKVLNIGRQVQPTSPQNTVTGDSQVVSNHHKAGPADTVGINSSRRSADSGQDPVASPERPPSPTHAEKPEATETTIASSNGPKTEKDRDEGSTSTTLGGTQTHSQPSQHSRPTKRKLDKSSSTSVEKSSKTLAKQKDKAPQSPKLSFLSKLLKKFIPCIGLSSAHSVDVGEGSSKTLDSSKEISEKEGDKDAENTEKDISSAEAQLPLPIIPSLIIPPGKLNDPDVILPPTPTKQLLPQSETEGVTSGAVVPPGSTGEPIDHHRNHTVRDSGDESEGTSFTEDEDDGNGMDDAEDEEDRLILNGGAGIPIGPDGVPRPLLPPLAQNHTGRKCLVLDLDETLVHSSFKSLQQADYVVPVEIEYHWHNVYVIKRPGVDNFLKKMGEIYEIVVFTASLSKYADPVLDKLDIHQVVSHRLFRESCYNHKGNYVKDLSQLGRPIKDTIILDNSPASYIFHPNNAVPVSSWFNDPHDTELTDLCPFLADLSGVDDVRGVLDGGL